MRVVAMSMGASSHLLLSDSSLTIPEERCQVLYYLIERTMYAVHGDDTMETNERTTKSENRASQPFNLIFFFLKITTFQ